MRKNGWYEGATLGNPNVPRDAQVYGSLVTMSGEVVTTYYVQYHNPPHPEYGKWSVWKVGDWKGDKPQPATYGEVVRLKGEV